jgi:hypothetical protein
MLPDAPLYTSFALKRETALFAKMENPKDLVWLIPISNYMFH